ncbi:asparagine synthase (glutamine-hydrolyzing) [Castellaniella caeni]
MCGIAGLLYQQVNRNEASLAHQGELMMSAIFHRGPDGCGLWADEKSGVGLAHRRLSIVDLSPMGHQPMTSPSKRYIMVFNGEIYNHLELRRELDTSVKAPAWRGHSDSETLLAGIDVWGVENAITRCVGMYAIALWDNLDKKLMLIRDRVGEKPLYYGWQGRGSDAVFLFGSELKALRAHPLFEAPIDRQAITLYLRHGYIPAPYSIYKGISKLPPGSILTISAGASDFSIRPYWSMAQMVARGGEDRKRVIPPDEAVEELDRLLRSAVSQQMVADVPLGAFLSGGIDSSAIVALMQAQSSRPVKTFTIGFHEKRYDEAIHARAVSDYLGTDHTELYVAPEDAMAVIPKLPQIFDEPFSDSSQIPTYLVSALARQHVAVSLSGDAGDELFCGYARYAAVANRWRTLSSLPMWLRQMSSRSVDALSSRKFMHNFEHRLRRAGEVLACSSVENLYREFVSHWSEPASLVLDGREPPTFLTDLRPDLSRLDVIERMMALDLITYLPDDILVKVDRAAMAVSLETRVPMLDHRVIEFAWSLPQVLKRSGDVGKWVLRKVLSRYVPQALIDRPKMGFGVPIDEWLRGPLRDWAESLLDESRLRRDGFFQVDPIRQKWMDHINGRHNWAYDIWNILMFQAWLESIEN